MNKYLYLIQDGSDLGTNTYKIGRTSQSPQKRLYGYPTNTIPIVFHQVDNEILREAELINLFRSKYTLARGNEYFSGNIDEMKFDFTNFCLNLVPFKPNVEPPNNIVQTTEIINKFSCKKCNIGFTSLVDFSNHVSNNYLDHKED